MNQELINQFKLQLIDALNLEGMTPDDIDNDAPLFGEGLGLDSIDALEIIVLLEKHYGIKLESPAQGKAIFRSISAIVSFIEANRTK